MPIKHAFTNPQNDGPDTTIVRPTDWNADHEVTYITPVQNVSSQSNASSLTLTITAPTEGNVLLLLLGTSGTRTISSVTTTNVTWSALVQETDGGVRVELWKGVVGASAGTSIAITPSGSGWNSGRVFEYAGITGTLDTYQFTSSTLGTHVSLLPTTEAVIVGHSHQASTTPLLQGSSTGLLMGTNGVGVYEWGYLCVSMADYGRRWANMATYNNGQRISSLIASVT